MQAETDVVVELVVETGMVVVETGVVVVELVVETGMVVVETDVVVVETGSPS